VDGPAARLAALLRQVRPQVVVTYEPGGGYGHPDHVRAHEVTTAAVRLAAAEGPGGEPWAVAKLYWTVLPASLAEQAVQDPEARAANPFLAPDPAAPRPSVVVPDDEVTTRIDGEAFRGAKVSALRAHATQLAVSDDGDFFATSNGIGQPVFGTEFYRLVLGRPGGALVGDGREADLFAGLYDDAEA
jgi:N-acetyl-1-D-myo-inositol-2-amino-2-deoxy-alpha-D-glucopyranoside deacetylase